MKKKILPIILIVLLVLIIAGAATTSVLVKKYSPSDERADLDDYFCVSSEDEIAIVYNDVLLQEQAKLIDGHIYLDYTFLHDSLNDRFYWDENENILLYTTSSDVISAESDSRQYAVSKSTVSSDYLIVKASASSAWVSLEFAAQYSDFSYTVCEKRPMRIVIRNDWGDHAASEVTKDTQIRIKGGIKSPILADVTKGTVLFVLAEDEDWTKVATEDGIIGYIRSKALGGTYTENLYSDYEPEEFSHILLDEPICMAWHQVTNRDANSEVASVLASTKGVNVISPTWFYLNDNQGGIADLADSDYVSTCHRQGVSVWGLVSNLENTSVDTTYVLTHTSSRQNLVNQIVSAAIQYNLDGINLDFEAISGEVGDGYIQFVRELSIKLANNGIILSVDNYVPSSYTQFYRRDEQALFADYVVIMGYDEHTSDSKEPGSVSSLSWVKEAVENTLLEVPAEQIILGMPFYTRIWTLTPDGGSDSEFISYSIDSSAYGMKAANNFINDHEMTMTWDEECGQYYCEGASGDVIYQIWLEDANSLEQRLQIMQENGLAGASFWKLGFETENVWETIIKYLN